MFLDLANPWFLGCFGPRQKRWSQYNNLKKSAWQKMDEFGYQHGFYKPGGRGSSAQAR
jgi:hypothetical protein